MICGSKFNVTTVRGIMEQFLKDYFLEDTVGMVTYARRPNPKHDNINYYFCSKCCGDILVYNLDFIVKEYRKVLLQNFNDLRKELKK